MRYGYVIRRNSSAYRHWGQRGWRTWGVVITGFLCLVLISGGCREEAQDNAEPVERPSRALTDYCDLLLGNEDAAILVRTVLPVGTGCQDGIGLYLADLAQRHPEVFCVEIHDMKSDKGRALMRANGIKCAAVLVDGDTRFDLGGDAGKVLLEGPMDPMDVYRVLHMKVKSTAGADLSLPVPEVEDGPRAEQRRKAGF